ncbi:MAG: SDR family NAD(P)-dependent oxidoreductase [Thermosynechococcaceae cyanobacterium]
MFLKDQPVSNTDNKTIFIHNLKVKLAHYLQQSVDQISDQKLVKALLLEAPFVEDCTILSRQSTSGEKINIAYVVLSEPFSAERLRSHLQSVLPDEWADEKAPQAYVPILTMPLTPEGEVDSAALEQIAVLDDALVNAWETQLNAIAELDRAAVVVQPNAREASTVHISDLVPNWGRTSETVPDSQSVQVDNADRVAPQSSPDAVGLTYGGDLPIDPDDIKTLPAMLKRAAQVPGERINYLQSDSSVIAVSYGDLLVEAERILGGLRQQGLAPQDKIIFQLELNQDIIPAFWACILGGFIPVIMGVAPTYQEANSVVDKLCNIWKLIDQPLILTTSALQNSLQGLTQWLSVDDLKVASIEALRIHPPDTAHHSCQSDDLTFFNLTSGSTGMPKCIGLTHWNLIARARGTNLLCNHTEDDVILNWLPFDHIGSISDWHIRCVYLACNLVYASKEYILGHPLNWMDLLDRYRITHSWAPNFAYALVNDGLKEGTEHSWDLSCVQSLLTAGEAVSSRAVEDFIDNLSAYGFKKTAVRPAFGMAEMGSGITYFQPTEAQPFLRHVVDKASLSGGGPIRRVGVDHANCSVFTDLGPVIPGVSIRIVNTQNELLSEDTVGYLQVKGDAVSPGYYKNPEVNKEVFLPDGWFNTGDLGFISNGHLVVSGRAKETIIINGANYYNHEIEAVVETVDGVEVSYTAACAVSDSSGATEKLAIFFHASHADETALTQMIRQVRQTVVSKIALNPDYLIPVEKAAVPKTAIGKIQRSQLIKRFEAGEFNEVVKHVDCLLKNSNTLPNWFFRKVWQPKQATVSIQTAPGPTLIFLDDLGTGAQLSDALAFQGHDCIQIQAGTEFKQVSETNYQLNPADPKDYRRLVRSVVEVQGAIQHVLHLWSLEPLSVEGDDAKMIPWLYSVLFLFQALEAEQNSSQPIRCLIGGNAVQSVADGDALVAQKAAVLGLIKTAAQEFDWLDCQHVDLPEASAEEQAIWLEHELLVNQFEREVVYRDGKRWVPRFERMNWQDSSQQHVSAQERVFKAGGLYVLSGGLGGVGVAIAQYLLETFDAKLLLLGRTALPDPQTWESLANGEDSALSARIKAYQALTQLGDVHYEAVDLGNARLLDAMVKALEHRWQQPMDGILHLAGVASERSIVDETQASFAATLFPKLDGTLALSQLLPSRPKCKFISFSSVNGFFGGNQTSAYAAANSFLDAFHHTLRQKDSQNNNPRNYCLAWSMWDDTGMSHGYQMKEFSQIQGYYAISPSQAIQSMLGCLHHQLDQAWIGLDGTKRNVQRYLQAPTAQMQTLNAYLTTGDRSPDLAQIEVRDRFGTVSQCVIHQLDEMPYTATGEIDRDQLVSFSGGGTQQVKPRTELEQQLAHLWQDILGVPQVGVQDSFFELGGSSLQAARLFAAIDEKLGKNLPLTTLFTAQTVEKLASLLGSEKEDTHWSLLVPIQPEGTHLPLFCIHGAGGNILMYRELATYVGNDQPLYGLQAVGLDGGTPITRLQEMAEIYITQLREFQPDGPYLLLGLSVGGMIAVEMANQLRQQGQEVAFLGMIDSLGPGYPKLMPVVPRFFSLLPFALSHNAQRIPAILRKKLSQKPRQAGETNSVAARTVTSVTPSTDSKRPNVQSATATVSSLGFPWGYLENLTLSMIKYSPWAFVVPRFYLDSGRAMPDSFQKVQEATVKAFLNYNPEPYDGTATLFRATQQPPGCYPDLTLGWGKVVKDLDIYDVPGHHGESLLYEQKSLESLGSQLSTCLKQTQGRLCRQSM